MQDRTLTCGFAGVDISDRTLRDWTALHCPPLQIRPWTVISSNLHIKYVVPSFAHPKIWWGPKNLKWVTWARSCPFSG